MGLEVQKPKWITMSKWDNRCLTAEQVQYATVDAFLSYEIRRKLNGPFCNSNFSLSPVDMLASECVFCDCLVTGCSAIGTMAAAVRCMKVCEIFKKSIYGHKRAKKCYCTQGLLWNLIASR
ncbi:hypothetical protein JHK82_018547 [Glycine max]|nr:hypothetical protein JHK87_018438 [Glycine soja]KAG5142852.1 hypothetical protein JHK82_018547 [Glycine max]